jgi:hypothetical protein
MGEVVFLFGEPGEGVPMLRKARAILAEYFLPESRTSTAQCLARLRSMLMAKAVLVVPTRPDGRSAAELVAEARALLRQDNATEQQLLNGLVTIFDGTDAQRFAAVDLPTLVDLG